MRWVRLKYLGNPHCEVRSESRVDNVERPWLFGQPLCLGGTLMGYVNHRLNSSSDNAEHW